MFACMHVCMYICMYACICTSVSVCLCLSGLACPEVPICTSEQAQHELHEIVPAPMYEQPTVEHLYFSRCLAFRHLRVSENRGP